MHLLTAFRGVPAFVVLVFGLAYGIGFGAMLLDRVFGLDLLSEPYVYIILIVVAWLPTTIGFVMSGICDGKRGVTELFARSFSPARLARINPGWWYTAAFGGFASQFVAIAVYQRFGGTEQIPTHTPLQFAISYVTAFPLGALSEEFGWRGFLQPRLQRLIEDVTPITSRFSPLVSAICVGILWGPFHLPAFFVPLLNQNHLNMATFFLFSIAYSILMAFVVNSTRYCTLMSVLLHNAGNSSGLWPPPGSPSWPSFTGPPFFFSWMVTLWVIAFFVVTSVGGRLGEREEWAAELENKGKEEEELHAKRDYGSLPTNT